MVKISRSYLEKIYSALIIPMRSDQSIHYENLSLLTRRQLKDGVEGFYCCGSSGEGLLLTKEERKKVVETVIQAVNKKVPVIAHVGTIRTEDAIELAHHAQSIGVDAISLIPPYYYNFSIDEILSYYEDVIRAVPGMPVILYNVPEFTGVEFNKHNARRILDSESVIGIKHTSQNLYAMERILQAYPDKILFNGFDEQYLGALSMGATATIGTTVNLFMPLFKKVRSFYEQGDMPYALQIQNVINHNVEVMVSYGIFNAIKYGWTVRGIDCGWCRPPFKAFGEQGKTSIEELIN